MKIRMFKNLEVPNANYEKGATYNIDAHSKEDSGRFETLYTLFVKAGYAEEIKELANHYVQHKAHGERYLHFHVCNTCKYACNYNEAPCTYCKLRDMQADINSKIIDLIKSL